MIKGSRLPKFLFLALILASTASLSADYPRNTAGLSPDVKHLRAEAAQQAWGIYRIDQSKMVRPAGLQQTAANRPSRRSEKPRKTPKGHQDHPSYPSLFNEPLILLAQYRIEGSRLAARIETTSFIHTTIRVPSEGDQFNHQDMIPPAAVSIEALNDLREMNRAESRIYGALQSLGQPLPYSTRAFLTRQTIVTFNGISLGRTP